ncbi:MAG: hypothetical protein KDB17_08115 [Ilumatobacter sp.]|nr:hypothetical protein [Ilumatobacter sp.]
MSVLGIAAIAGRLIAGEEVGVDSDGHITSHSWLLPDKAELIWGTLSSLLIFGLLWKFAGPAIKKSMAARTERIQKELDAAAADKAAAATEAAEIRQAKGDIDAARARILGEAEEQAALVLSEGRARLEQEISDLRTRTTAEIASMGSRAGDELRAEIARLSHAAVDHVVKGSLDDSTQQELIESFISRVGASA